MTRLLLVLFALLLPGVAAAQSFPPLTGRVVDAANLLSPEQEAELTRISQEVETASTRQFVVATVPSLEGRAIEDYGYRLGRAWGIGQKGANNGIILLVAPTERKVRIEVGYGLEPIMTDALSSYIVNGAILPRFKAGDYPGGILDGARAIADQMKMPLEAAEKRAAALGARKAKASSDAGDWITAIFWIVVIFFVILPLFFGRTRGRRYRGGAGPVVIWGPSSSGWGSGGSSWGSGGSSWGGGGGGFSGGGGSFGGGGASGSW